MSQELSHRIKNIFAVIGGLIGLCSYRQPENKAFAQELGGRMMLSADRLLRKRIP
jgi:two-component sensor histidine kinase